MVETFNWGIISTGTIATAFAKAINHLDDATLLAVGSRSQESADAFGDTHAIPRRYASYEALVADDDVDIVYIGTPHVYHAANMRLCLEHGKHVLCEKPFTINADEAQSIVELAEDKGLFVMEALWTRFLPAVVQARAWVDEGRIGDIRTVQADFSVVLPYDPESRIYDLELGGGALLDIGIYPISLTTFFLGMPDRISSHAAIGETGVDEKSELLFSYEGGAAALLNCDVRTQGTQEAVIKGDAGYIKFHAPFHHPQQVTLYTAESGEAHTHDIPYESTGLNYEAAEVHKCLRSGNTESAIMPLRETVATMQLMDALRAEWGVVYPSEES